MTIQNRLYGLLYTGLTLPRVFTTSCNMMNYAHYLDLERYGSLNIFLTISIIIDKFDFVKRFLELFQYFTIKIIIISNKILIVIFIKYFSHKYFNSHILL